MNIAAYYYEYTGLQVGSTQLAADGVPIIRTVNAGGAETYGIDFEAAYYPAAIEGMSLNASVNWNHARYTELDNIPCYGGQTIAQGCTQFLIPNTGLFTAQDLSGTQMIRAPEWAANFGFNYELPVGSGMTLALSNNNQFSSEYPTFLAIGRPGDDNFQDSFIKVDLGLALEGVDERWEVALIGKNITDEITTSNCTATNFAGAAALGGAITGGTTSGAPGFSETACYTDVGRSVWVRLTYRH